MVTELSEIDEFLAEQETIQPPAEVTEEVSQPAQTAQTQGGSEIDSFLAEQGYDDSVKVSEVETPQSEILQEEKAIREQIKRIELYRDGLKDGTYQTDNIEYDNMLIEKNLGDLKMQLEKDKNEKKPALYTEEEAQTDEEITGDAEPLTRLNQYINTMDLGQKRAYATKGEGKTDVNELLDIAQKVSEPRWYEKAYKKIEKPVEIVRDIGRGVASDILRTPMMIEGLKKAAVEDGGVRGVYYDMMGEKLREMGHGEDVDKYLEKKQKQIQKIDEKIKTIKNLDKELGLEPKVSELAFNVGSGASSLAKSVGIALLVKNPALQTRLPAVLFAGMSYSDTYINAREKDKTPAQARQLAALAGAFEYSLEKVGLDYFLKPGTGGKIIRGIKRALAEGSQEMSQELKDNLIAKYGYDKTQDWKQGIAQAGFIGVLLGGGANFVMPSDIEQDMDDAGVTTKQKDEIKGKFINKPELQLTKQQQKDIIKELEDEGFINAEGIAEARKQGLIPEEELEYERAVKRGEVVEEEEIEPTGEEKFQEVKEKKPFYSKLEKTITEKMPPKMGAEQFKGWLANQGLKGEELDYFDLPTALQGKEKITKEEALSVVRGNMLETEETVLGEKGNKSLKELESRGYIVEEDMSGESIIKDKKTDEEIEYDDLPPDIQKLVGDVGENIEEIETKYGKYTLPGGENYREVLLRMPVENVKDDFYKFKESLVSKYGNEQDMFSKKTEEETKKYNQLRDRAGIAAGPTKGVYKSSHFDQTNILAHTRVKDFTDTQGNKVMLIEEIQSDWHQEGRKKGYKTKKEIELFDKWKKLSDEMNTLADDRDPVTNRIRQEEKWHELAREREAINREQAGVPDAPFKKTWHEFAFKKMLNEAIEKDYDKLAWTPGDLQAERYDLSKQIKRVGYTKRADGLYDLSAESLEERAEPVYSKEGITLKEIEDVIGKELTQKIENEEGEIYERRKGNVTGELSGLDLKVGGEGMKGFYDKMLPKFVNKYLKKFDGKLSTTKIKLEDGKTEEVWSIDLTPELKANIKREGQPLFQKEAKERKPSERILEVAKTRRILGLYNLKPELAKGTFKIRTPDGKLASGSYLDWGIKIAQIAQETTGYHEAAHLVFEKFADRGLFDKAMAEIQKETGIQDATKLEDELAERFARYVNKVDTQKGAISRFFNRLIQTLKSAFKGNMQTNKLFQDILKGKKRPQFKILSKEKFQALSDAEQQKYIKDLQKSKEDMIKQEMQVMQYEIDEAQKGERIFKETPEGYDVDFKRVEGKKSTFPEWSRDMGLASKKGFATAMKRGNKGHDLIVEEAIKRLGKGYKYAGQQMEADPEYKQAQSTLEFFDEEAAQQMEDKFIGREILERREAGRETVKEIKKKEPFEAFKEGKKKGRQEGREKLIEKIKTKDATIAQFKKDVIEYAQKYLPLRERGKLLAKIKNVKTELQRFDAITYIDRLGKADQVRKFKSSINKMLSKTETKKVGGKPVGKYNPAVQKTLDMMRVANKMTRQQATEKTQANIEKLETIADDKQNYNIKLENDLILQNKVLDMITNIEDKTPVELARLKDEIQSIIDTGKLTAAIEKFNRQSRVDRWIDENMNVITGGKGLPLGMETVGDIEIKRDTRKKVIDILNTTTEFVQGYKDILDMLSSLDTTSKPGQSYLSKWGNVLQEKNAEKKGLGEAVVSMRIMVKEAYNLTKDRQVVKKLNEINKEESLGVFKNADGVSVELTFSKNEAIKRWLEMQDPTLENTFNEGMKYTDEIRSAIENFLTPQDKAFAQKQKEFYREYYGTVTEVYAGQYGVDLGFNNEYSPIARKGVGKETYDSDILQPVMSKPSVLNKSLKGRVDNVLPLKQLASTTVLDTHVNNMEHFKHWVEKVRDLRAVFNNPKIRTAIEMYHGKELTKALDSFVDDFARGGIDRANNINLIDKFRAGHTRATLAGKIIMMPKQLTSFMAFADDVPIQHFVKGFAKFMKNPVKHTRMLLDSSEALKARGRMGFERDVAQALKSDANKNWKKSRKFLDQLFLFTELGDKGAIVAGGFTVYNYWRGKGLSHKDAITKFEDSFESAQQSADLSDLSRWQRGNSFAKLFTMYKTTPNQYFRKEIGAVRNLLAKRITKRKFAKTIFIYHILLPMLFQLVSDGLKWDPDEQKRAMIAGSLNGFFILGDGLEYIIRKTLGQKTYGFGLPALGWLKEIGDGFGKLAKSDWDITSEDFFEGMEDLTNATGARYGLPTKQVINYARSGQNMIEGEYGKALAGFMGYTAYSVDKMFEKKKRRRRR